MRKLLLLILLLLPLEIVTAQGFGIFNGRNHPNIKWREAETEHFRIVYPEHLDGVQNLIASIAEETHESLTKLFGHTPKKKLLIGVSDEDEISNGYAVPFGFTMLWVNVNDYAQIWTGNEKWLRKVIAHELAHLLHFEAIKTRLPFIIDFSLNDTPGEWYEGIAQYTTEKWDSERGDRWLRKLIYDDLNEQYNSLYAGGAYYAIGNSQVRHFAQTYGDSSLTKLLQFRKEGLFDIDYFKSYSFTEGFKDVTGVEFIDFERSWWKHVQIYYNTMAGQMERLDSLKTKPVNIPGEYIRAIATSKSGKNLAVVSLESLDRPTTELFWLTEEEPEKEDEKESKKKAKDKKEDDKKKKEKQPEIEYKKKRLAYGPINGDVTISPDESKVAYSMISRTINGNLVPDVYTVEVKRGKIKRITNGRRASNPVFGPNGEELAYIANEKGTANVFKRNLSSGKEEKVTNFKGDVQIVSLAWNHQREEMAYSIFDDNAERMLIVRDLKTGQERVIDDSLADNRIPVFSPDGSKMMFTSLRDQVPNVFIHDLETHKTERASWLFAGAYGFAWSDADSLHPEGKLWLKGSERFTKDEIYAVDASRRIEEKPLFMNPSFSTWTQKLPPDTIAYKPEPRPDFVYSNKKYSPIKDTRMLFGVFLPYVDARDRLGLSAFGMFSDPLGKHQLLFSGDLSFYDPRFSALSFLYTNNTLKPSLNFFYSTNLFGIPYVYDGQVLTNNNRNVGGVLASLPIDFLDLPYSSTTLNVRLRTSDFRPVDFWDFKRVQEGPTTAQSGLLNDVRVSLTIGQYFPDRSMLIAPRDGFGLRFAATKAIPEFGSHLDFLITDLSAYKIFNLFGSSSLYLYGRGQAISGNRLNQFFVGFNRFDDPVLIPSATLYDIFWDVSERVRGFRDFASGDRAAFGSAELRLPILPSLGTSILGGLVSFDQVVLAPFIDAGVVSNVPGVNGNELVQRIGTGAELKNQVSILGLPIIQSFGYGQPIDQFGTRNQRDFYYRIRASIVF